MDITRPHEVARIAKLKLKGRVRRLIRRMRRVARNRVFVDGFLRFVPLPMSEWMYWSAKRVLLKDSRERLFDAVFDQTGAMGTPGDYLEFGVFRGTSFALAYRFARRNHLDQMRFFAFDSFEGLPSSEGRIMKKGDYASPRRTFETLVRKSGVDMSKVHVVEGYFSDTLNDSLKDRFRLSRAAVVHIDCDLYSSAREVLEFVAHIIDSDTVIIFDDWYSFRYDGANIEDMGERRAFNEWPLKRRFEVLYDEPNVSKAFIMKDE